MSGMRNGIGFMTLSFDVFLGENWYRQKVAISAVRKDRLEGQDIRLTNVKNYNKILKKKVLFAKKWLTLYHTYHS